MANGQIDGLLWNKDYQKEKRNHYSPDYGEKNSPLLNQQ